MMIARQPVPRGSREASEVWELMGDERVDATQGNGESSHLVGGGSRWRKAVR